MTATGTRIGGHLVAESLAALGAQAVFGVPGIHSLAIWEALRTGPVDGYGARAAAPAARPRCCCPPDRGR